MFQTFLCYWVSKTLRRLGAILDTRHDTVEFSSIFPGLTIPLIRGRNGHMLLNLVEDWVPPHYDVVPGQLTVTHAVPDKTEKQDESNAPSFSETAFAPPSLSPVGVFTSQVEPATSNDILVQDPSEVDPLTISSFPSGNCPTSHVLQLSSVDGNREEEEGQGRDVCHLGEPMGLGSSGRSRLTRSEGERPTVSWSPPGRTDGERKQERLQRPRNVEDLQSMQPSPVVHTGSGCQRSVPTSPSFAQGYPRCDRREGHQRSSRGPHLSVHWGACCRKISAEETREGSARESQPEQGEADCSAQAQDLTGYSHDRLSSSEGQERECSETRGSGSEGREGRVGRPDASSQPTVNAVNDGDDHFSESCFARSLTPADVELLEHSLKTACNELQEALASLPGSQMDLIEVCCGPDSALVSVLHEKGGNGGRVGLHNNMNLTTTMGLQRAREFCDQTCPRYLWLSPICGPTSLIQNLNANTPEQCEKLRKKQKVSRKMAKSCVTLALDQLRRGGHVVWEWPKGNRGWKFKEVQHLLHTMQKNHVLFEGRLDGCMVGTVAPDCGIPMRKPWCIKTSDSQLAQVLNIPCNGQHEHVECLGHNRADASAFYPRKMCSLVVRHVLSNFSDEGHAVFGIDFGVDGEQSMVGEEFGDSSKGLSTRVESTKSFGENMHEPTAADMSDVPQMNPKELKDLKDTIHRLHVRSGHPTNQALINCLKARGVPKHVLETAKEHKCDSCHEVRLPQPHKPYHPF